MYKSINAPLRERLTSLMNASSVHAKQPYSSSGGDKGGKGVTSGSNWQALDAINQSDVAISLSNSQELSSSAVSAESSCLLAPYPFPVTLTLIAEGIKRLRTAASKLEDAHTPVTLWRGVRNAFPTDQFFTSGGSEVAPMSATADLQVALRYATSSTSLLLKIETASFIERGVSLSYLSCFPEENEHLFSPLTYLRPTGRQSKFECESGRSITVIEVLPTFGT
uniref:Mono(ADP-ribosyl)transferase n=1 Tax=Haptolina brevifila TaxID=156173 RepID=A0A6U7GD48_9EUKA